MKGVTAILPLREVVRFRVGPPFRERIIHEDGGSYGVVQGKEIGSDGHLDLSDMVRLTKVPGKGKPDILHAGEIVLQARGTSYRAAVVPQSDIPLVAAGSLYILSPDASRIDSEYLVFFLNLPNTQATMRQLATGSYILNLRRAAVEAIEVPLPIISDQRRLAELGRLVRKQSEINERLNKMWLQELYAVAVNRAKDHSPRSSSTSKG